MAWSSAIKTRIFLFLGAGCGLGLAIFRSLPGIYKNPILDCDFFIPEKDCQVFDATAAPK